MLRIDDRDRTHFVDPFYGGAIYDRNRCEQKLSELAERPVVLSDSAIEPCSSQVLISRMLRNLKVIYGRSGDVASLLPIQRRLTALNHGDPGELRDLGILCVQADRLGEAIEPLQAYVDLSPESDDAGEIGELAGGLAAKLHAGTDPNRCSRTSGVDRGSVRDLRNDSRIDPRSADAP